MALPFTDQGEVDMRREGYVVTNESPAMIAALVKELRPTDLLAISGGGEVPLLSFLPWSAQVSAIDISLRSLAATALKAEMIRAYRTDALLKAIDGPGEGLMSVFEELAPTLPAALYPHAHHAAHEISVNKLNELQATWLSTKPAVIDAARENLEGLCLIRGDLRAQGPQRCIYSSNAIGWGLDGNALRTRDLVPLIEDGGYLLTSRPVRDPALQKIKGTGNPEREHEWAYGLYQKR